MAQSKQKGGIQKRGSKFLVRVGVPDPTLGVDPETGNYKKKIVRVGSFESMAEAIKARDRARYESEQGSLFANTGLTVEDFFRRWLVTHSLKIKPSTAMRYGVIVNSYIIPRLGGLPLNKLKPFQIGEFYSHLLKQGGRHGQPLSNGTVEMVRICLKMALEYGVNVERVISQNPALRVKTPKVIHHKNTPWTTEQVRTFLEYLESHDDYRRLIPFFRLSVFTGARNGELLALEWSDFDPIEARITISKSRSRGSKNESVSGTTKTGRIREVYLDAQTVSLLNTHKENQRFDRILVQGHYAEKNYIFANHYGEPLGDRTPYQIIKRSQRVLGLPRQKLHDLRAFVITELLGEGVSPHEVSDRVGAKAETLMKHYASVRPERRILVANQYGERMNAKLAK
jgi:integrase